MAPSTHLGLLQERNLAEIRDQLAHMSEAVQRALADAVRALQTHDRRLAYSVILADNRIDALQHAVDHLCQVFLVRHMPAGGVLRFVVAALKVNSELERIGDYAEAIAHRAITLLHVDSLAQIDALEAMFRLCTDLLARAMDAFLRADVERAHEVLVDEERSDEMNHEIFHALTQDENGGINLSTRFALVGVLNRLERVADRATNIAEHTIYATRGEVLPSGPRGGHRVLLLSRHDGWLGPMAEMLGNSRAPLTVAFFSAGLNPKAAFDVEMMEYMAGRGYALPRHRPRGLDEVGPIEAFTVVVTLTREAEEDCPPLPYRTVELAWDLLDPSSATDTGQPMSLDQYYDEIQSRLNDLLDALFVDHPDRKESP